MRQEPNGNERNREPGGVNNEYWRSGMITNKISVERDKTLKVTPGAEGNKNRNQQ